MFYFSNFDNSEKKRKKNIFLNFCKVLIWITRGTLLKFLKCLFFLLIKPRQTDCVNVPIIGSKSFLRFMSYFLWIVVIDSNPFPSITTTIRMPWSLDPFSLRIPRKRDVPQSHKRTHFGAHSPTYLDTATHLHSGAISTPSLILITCNNLNPWYLAPSSVDRKKKTLVPCQTSSARR